MDEQPPDEGAASTLHNQIVGHLPGTNTHPYTKQSHYYCAFCYLCYLISICLALCEISEKGVFSDNDIYDCLTSGSFVIPAIISSPAQWYDAT